MDKKHHLFDKNYHLSQVHIKRLQSRNRPKLMRMSTDLGRFQLSRRFIPTWEWDMIKIFNRFCVSTMGKSILQFY